MSYSNDDLWYDNIEEDDMNEDYGIRWGCVFALAFCIAFWILAIMVITDVLWPWVVR